MKEYNGEVKQELHEDTILLLHILIADMEASIEKDREEFKAKDASND